MDTIDGKIFRGMLESGYANLNNRRKEVDALNVFPVPDGDTGTNMSLTFTSGMSEVRKSGSEDLPTVAKTLARGMLMGARGNSGVILSQIFRGFNGAVGDKQQLSVEEFADALLQGAMKAYKAVMRPVEGTILTVARESSEYASIYVKEHAGTSFEAYFDILCKEAKASLDRTPELLPVLKEARVVDSGGCGLKNVFDGFHAYLEGAPIVEGCGEENKSEEVKVSGYRTEFILRLSEQGVHLFQSGRFRDSLDKLGDHITIVNDDNLVKVRVNAMQPGEVLNLGQRYGEFDKIQIENLMTDLKDSILEEKEEAKEEPAAPQAAKKFGIITVCAGDGLGRLFQSYRADIVVNGGQTMNPSTEDFVKAVGKLNAENIYILPNNSNIIMAAKQAAEVTEGKNVIVLETKSIPQGLSACIVFNPEAEVSDNTAAMEEAIEHVKSGSVTYAIKDTVVDGREIHQGDFMGILDKNIILTEKDKVKAACSLIDAMCDDDSEIITLLQGKDASDEEMAAVQKYIESKYDVDIDAEKGDQPVYSFVIGVE